MSDRAPCVKCGRILHTGEGRVLTSFTADELFQMIPEVSNDSVRERLRCALSLLNEKMANEA